MKENTEGKREIIVEGEVQRTQETWKEGECRTFR